MKIFPSYDNLSGYVDFRKTHKFKHGYIIHKAKQHKKGRRHDYDVYKKNHPVTSPQVVNVIDLGYLGVEKDFPEQLSSHYHTKRKETASYHKKKKIRQ